MHYNKSPNLEVYRASLTNLKGLRFLSQNCKKITGSQRSTPRGKEKKKKSKKHEKHKSQLPPINSLHAGLFSCFTSQVNSYGHGGTVSSPNHTFFLGKLEQAVNQYFVHILSLVTDNDSAEGRRMTADIIS